MIYDLLVYSVIFVVFLFLFVDILRKIPDELINDRRIQLGLAAHRAFRDRNSIRYFKIMRKVGGVILFRSIQ